MRALAVLLLPVALAACGKPDNAPGPGGVSVGEARARRSGRDDRRPAAAEDRHGDHGIGPV